MNTHSCSLRPLRLGLLFLTQFLAVAILADASVAEETLLAGKVTSVTVYRDQARVVREIAIPASDTPQQVRVPDLPQQLIPQSWFTESSEGTDVLSLQVIANKEEDQDDQGEQKLRLKELQRKLKAAEQELLVIDQDMETLKELVAFSSDKVQQNLDRATLDVQSVTALADFTMERRRTLSKELYDKQAEIEAIQNEISEQRKQNALPQELETPSFEALMSVQATEGGIVRLVYDVFGVRWTPRYKIDGSQGDQPEFAIQMEAVIVQDSGEDWTDVSLLLATSTPQTQAAGPSLAPLRIHTASLDDLEDQGTAALGQFASPEQSASLDSELAASNFNLNLQAGTRQLDELTSTAEIQRKIALDAASEISDETYSLPGNVTLTTGEQPQTVTILRANLAGELYHVATPLLSSFAFREATLVNEAGKSLIAGSADVYLDKKFVGRIQMPPTAAGQKLTIGFGSDRQVRTRRELLSRNELIKGGNRRSELLFRLVVSNFHPEPIDLRLLDRIPISAKDDSINLTLAEKELSRLSEDPLYRRMQFPTGILRWDLNIPGKKFGSEAYDHDYGYSIEHDREQTLDSEDLAQRIQEDLQFQKNNMGGGLGGGGFF